MFDIQFSSLLAQAATATGNGASLSPNPINPWITIANILGIILGVFVLPFIVSAFLAKRLRMPSYGSSIGVILASIVGASLIVGLGFYNKKIRFGIDIKGGTRLVYELDKTSINDINDPLGQTNPILARELVPKLSLRLNPSGTKEMSITPYGDDQIEIVVPNVDQFEIQQIKDMISSSGILQFSIVANDRDHKAVFQAAQLQSQSTEQNVRTSNKILNDKGTVIGLWQTIGRDSKPKGGIYPLRQVAYGGDLIRDSRSGRILTPPPFSRMDGELALEEWLMKERVSDIDLLLSLQDKRGNPYEVVTGADLYQASSDIGKKGPEVAFTMKSSGAPKLGRLTSANMPDPDGVFHRRLAIVLDNRVLSAPSLNDRISDRGSISGNFTREEVDYLVSILRSGSLPAALNKTPINENLVGSLLGEDAINKGFIATAVSLFVTVAFVIAYYRFSGFVACFALLLNLLLTLAAMILIQQPITLPGLAGLVLTVGMSVDANVLVFERMREEIAKKATGRMAIRNGFDRALTTIIDSNLTTLISAVVLYWVGTDQVKGFAVVLIIGIIISMYTAVFCSRIIFDIAERWKFVSFSMGDLIIIIRKVVFGGKDYDFMSKRVACYIFSAALIGIGMTAAFVRGRSIFDIDFNGGTSVVFSIEKPESVDKVRDLTLKIFADNKDGDTIQSTLNTMKTNSRPAGTVYKLDTSLQDVNDLTKRLVDGFAGAGNNLENLVTYRVNAKYDGEAAALIHGKVAEKLVVFQNENPVTAVQPKAETKPSEPIVTTDRSNAESTTPTNATPENAESPKASSTTTPPVTNPASSDASALASRVTTAVDLSFVTSDGLEKAKINAPSLVTNLIESAEEVGLSLTPPQVDVNPVTTLDWTRESMLGFDTWKVVLPFDRSDTAKIITLLEDKMQSEPVWLSKSSIQTRVAAEMQWRALAALFMSMLGIVAYIWFRFQKIAFGLAAVVATVHDVLVPIGCIAISHWLFRSMGFLLIDDFKINLTVVAAFLTIMGYSLNDTIVVFDRIREVKGKSPTLTSEMINQSVNQTLGRTLLTSSTTIMTVLLLYIWGGEGIHSFAFCLLIGIIIGTYSSIFVASPILLWLFERVENRPTSPASIRKTA